MVGAEAFFFRIPQPNVRTCRIDDNKVRDIEMWDEYTHNVYMVLSVLSPYDYMTQFEDLYELFCFFKFKNLHLNGVIWD